MSVIANNVLQKSNITGTGAYSLEPPPVGFDSFVSRHGDGSEVFYTAQREDGQKKEFGRGIITAGTPDTLSRTVISSSNNDQAIDWQTADQPIFVYTSPPGSFLDDIYHGRRGYLIAGGSANAIAVTPLPKWTDYVAGNSVRVKIAATNTSETVNINVSTLGNKAVKMPSGENPPAGALVGGSIVEFVYEAVADVMIAISGFNVIDLFLGNIITNSGTTANFNSIPSGVKNLIFILSGVSFDADANLYAQIGDADGLEGSGYDNDSVTMTGGGNTFGGSSIRFDFLGSTIAAATSVTGIVNFFNITGNQWIMKSILHTAGGRIDLAGGKKSLSSELDRVQFADSGGDNFDTGAITGYARF